MLLEALDKWDEVWFSSVYGGSSVEWLVGGSGFGEHFWIERRNFLAADDDLAIWELGADSGGDFFCSSAESERRATDTDNLGASLFDLVDNGGDG